MSMDEINELDVVDVMPAQEQPEDYIPPADLFGVIEESLPPFFTRAKAVECLNGLFTINSLVHLTTKPGGPPVHYVGRKVVLRRDEFVAWLREYNRRVYGDDAETDGRRIRCPEGKKNGAGASGGGNKAGEGSGIEAPDSLGDVFAGLENS